MSHLFIASERLAGGEMSEKLQIINPESGLKIENIEKLKESSWLDQNQIQVCEEEEELFTVSVCNPGLAQRPGQDQNLSLWRLLLPGRAEWVSEWVCSDPAGLARSMT